MYDLSGTFLSGTVISTHSPWRGDLSRVAFAVFASGGRPPGVPGFAADAIPHIARTADHPRARITASFAVQALALPLPRGSGRCVYMTHCQAVSNDQTRGSHVISA